MFTQILFRQGEQLLHYKQYSAEYSTPIPNVEDIVELPVTEFKPNSIEKILVARRFRVTHRLFQYTENVTLVTIHLKEL